MRIIFMGTAELSCASLEKLVGQASSLSLDRQDACPTFSIVAVVTQPDKPKGRELKPQPSPVKILAQKLNLPILQPAKARDEQFISELRELKPDLIVVVAYGQILPQSILDLPKFGCLNVHTSLLPKYRGASPIQSAILNGETETGVTIMKMDAGLDTGEIISQKQISILPEDNSQTLHDRLAQLGAELLAQTILDYVAGKIQPQPQNNLEATHTAKIKKEDGKIDWNEPAEKILNRLRAFTPWPGVFTFFPNSVGRASARAETEIPERLAGTLAPPKQQLLKIWKAEVIEGRDAALRRPDSAARCPYHGEILSADKNGIVVACGKDSLRILELQREGGRRLSAQEFLAGNPLRIGERFSPEI